MGFDQHVREDDQTIEEDDAMIAITRRKLLFAGALSAGLMTSAAGTALGARRNPRSSSSDYHDLWRKLWEDHITWTRVVILGILDELPGTTEYTARLLKNYEDMEDTLAPQYGDDAEVLGDLIKDHLTIAAEILTAARNGNTTAFNDAVARWYANGNQIAAQMNLMNPQFWPLDETTRMWTEHLDATLEEAQTHLNGDFGGEVAAYDKVHDLALERADFFSDGVIQQFPQAFQRR